MRRPAGAQPRLRGCEMARIRTVKPEFFTSEDIVALTPWARLLYIALWCEADRKGRLRWKPLTFKMRYFPADSIDINELCQELLGVGLVKTYGDSLAYIPRFSAHQHINPREAESTLPDPDACSTREARVHDPSSPVSDGACTATDAQGGKERKGTLTTSRVTRDEGFTDFWEAYPKKINKGQAEKAFAKLNPNEDLLSTIVAAVERAKTREQWRKDGGQFIPYPATWLNARGWEDEDIAPLAAAARPQWMEGVL